MKPSVNVAVIGLDTSHTVEFTRRLQAPDCPDDQRVEGMRVVTCLRFATPFQTEEGLDARQQQLEAWGVAVTTDFAAAVADCDAVMIEINDPSLHLDYFQRCAELGKPIYLDKPLAATLTDGRAIVQQARERGVPLFSASALRFVPELLVACQQLPHPHHATVYGPLGRAAAGSSIVWYGVHAVEMLQRAMGRGAQAVTTRLDAAGAVIIVEYPGQRRGLVELNTDHYLYGGSLRDQELGVSFAVDMGYAYREELRRIVPFCRGGESPVSLDDTLEVMAILDAAEHSLQAHTTITLDPN